MIIHFSTHEIPWHQFPPYVDTKCLYTQFCLTWNNWSEWSLFKILCKWTLSYNYCEHNNTKVHAFVMYKHVAQLSSTSSLGWILYCPCLMQLVHMSIHIPLQGFRILSYVGVDALVAFGIWCCVRVFRRCGQATRHRLVFSPQI